MTEVADNPTRCVLTVDDDRILLALLKAQLLRAGYEVMQAASGEQALELLHEARLAGQRMPDLAVLDVSLPGMSGIALARQLRKDSAIPFMFLSSYQEAGLVRQAAEEGAVGYLVKPVYPAHLIPAVEAALTRAGEISELRRTAARLSAALASRHEHGEMMQRELERLSARYEEELNRLALRLDQAQRKADETDAHARELARLAHEDTLTGLPNRHWLMHHLPGVLQRTQSVGGMTALLYLDLDGFKRVNDSLGHPAGDELLRAAALRMKSALKPGDCVTRHGGDEFIIVVEQLRDESDAAHVAQRMADVLKNPFELFGGSSSVGASIGISLFPRDGADAEELLRHADLALYRAKSEGKGRHCFYEPELARRNCG